jgi:anti-sigma regulatory factor (Ser/Thr protein kinase)
MTVPSAQIEDLSVAAGEYVDARTVRIRIGEGNDPNRIIEQVQRLFDRLFRDGAVKVFLDMRNVAYPNASFIAMLVQRAAEARRLGGDVLLVGMPATARSHLSLFSPLTYLSLGEPDVDAEEPEAASLESAEPENSGSPLEDGVPYKLQVPATFDSLNRLTDFVSSLALAAGFEKVETSRLKIAVYEAGMNVIEHGYTYGPDECMGIEVRKEGDRFLVALTDTGQGFDFYENPVYDVEAAVEERRQGGFGRYIIERSVDEVYYQRGDDGNRLTLVKYLNKN